MASHRRTPILFLTLLVLSLGVLSKGACTSKVFSLPAVEHGPHLYLLELGSADTFCESQGYSKTGSVRSSTLNTLDLPVSAVQMRPFKVLGARSTDIILSVECLKTGQTACATDEDGNTGAGKQGKNQIEDFHVGDWNIGNLIGGNANCVYNNEKDSLQCKKAVGVEGTLNMRSLKEVNQSVLNDYHQSPSPVQAEVSLLDRTATAASTPKNAPLRPPEEKPPESPVPMDVWACPEDSLFPSGVSLTTCGAGLYPGICVRAGVPTAVCTATVPMDVWACPEDSLFPSGGVCIESSYPTLLICTVAVDQNTFYDAVCVQSSSPAPLPPPPSPPPSPPASLSDDCSSAPVMTLTTCGAGLYPGICVRAGVPTAVCTATVPTDAWACPEDSLFPSGGVCIESSYPTLLICTVAVDQNTFYDAVCVQSSSPAPLPPPPSPPPSAPPSPSNNCSSAPVMTLTTCGAGLYPGICVRAGVPTAVCTATVPTDAWACPEDSLFPSGGVCIESSYPTLLICTVAVDQNTFYDAVCVQSSSPAPLPPPPSPPPSAPPSPSNNCSSAPVMTLTTCGAGLYPGICVRAGVPTAVCTATVPTDAWACPEDSLFPSGGVCIESSYPTLLICTVAVDQNTFYDAVCVQSSSPAPLPPPPAPPPSPPPSPSDECANAPVVSLTTCGAGLYPGICVRAGVPTAVCTATVPMDVWACPEDSLFPSGGVCIESSYPTLLICTVAVDQNTFYDAVCVQSSSPAPLPPPPSPPPSPPASLSDDCSSAPVMTLTTCGAGLYPGICVRAGVPTAVCTATVPTDAWACPEDSLFPSGGVCIESSYPTLLICTVAVDQNTFYDAVCVQSSSPAPLPPPPSPPPSAPPSPSNNCSSAPVMTLTTCGAGLYPGICVRAGVPTAVCTATVPTDAWACPEDSLFPSGGVCIESSYPTLLICTVAVDQNTFYDAVPSNNPPAIPPAASSTPQPSTFPI
ncbi:hypothetical protein ACKKBG_A11645 [Auxenochlorella protothecoides x Auxenochlorella symbiontica]